MFPLKYYHLNIVFVLPISLFSFIFFTIIRLKCVFFEGEYVEGPSLFAFLSYTVKNLLLWEPKRQKAKKLSKHLLVFGLSDCTFFYRKSSKMNSPKNTILLWILYFMFIKRTHNVKYWKVTLEIPNNIKIAPESMLVDKIFNTRSLGALGPWLLGRPANGCTNIRIEWKTLGCTHFPEICFHLPSIWHEYQDKKKIPEIWFHPPNVWHEYQDRIENVAFYAHHRNMFTPPKMFCTNIRIE